MWPGISYSSEHIVLSGLFYHWINAALVCNAMLSQTTWCKIPFAEKFTYDEEWDKISNVIYTKSPPCSMNALII